jgi:hypothetical protein
MPTLELPTDHEETAVFEATQRLTEPRGIEARKDFAFFDEVINEAFRSSKFLQVQSQYRTLRSSLVTCSRLIDDWNSYGAEKPSAHTLALTLRLLNKLRDQFFLPSQIVPSAEGGVAAYFKADDRVSYLEYRNSGEVILAMYDRQREPDIRELTDNDVDESKAIAIIRQYIRA